MLLGALLDLPGTRKIIEDSLALVGKTYDFELATKEDKTQGLRGLKVIISKGQSQSNIFPSFWRDIRDIILHAHWSTSLKKKIYSTYSSLAEAEAAVHGCDIEEVHFHELGKIETLINIVGVCAAVEYLNPDQIICSNPPTGFGDVETSHGILPIPVPVVLELARKFQIELASSTIKKAAELTTPTGLALMACLCNNFGQPESYIVKAIGIGLGNRILDQPNLLRVCELDQFVLGDLTRTDGAIKWQKLVTQEAWIDDVSSEDIAVFTDQLRKAGAIEVTCNTVQMKKSRQGFCIKAIVLPDKAADLRKIWFENEMTIGLRERLDGRWTLLRREGSVLIESGKVVSAKQIQRPDGRITIKPEHDDLVRVSLETGKSIDSIRKEFFLSKSDFISEEDWTL